MSESHYAATGLLVLDRVTPMIAALFGEFNLKANCPGKGRAGISLTPGRSFPCWENIHFNLFVLGAHLRILPDREETPDPQTILSAWAGYFHVERDAVLQSWIERHPIRDTADLSSLFLLATRFDDGHKLTAIAFEGCWHSRAPRLFGYGGDACYHSREFVWFNESSQVLFLGNELSSALRKGNTGHASTVVITEILRLLDGIQDEAARAKVRQYVAGFLTDYPAVKDVPI
ncbi:MAG: hypothetical protein LBD06_07185 [Candidatus Accumulibacter sp.]|jgi:hypothetical protein|nr:hypothetical protein [Accumulibacter sp.]